MKFAILGGGGCFGLNLARLLLAGGHEVVGCGRSPLRGEAFTLGTDRMGYRYRPYVIGPDNEFIIEWLDHERPEVIVNFAAQGEGAASYKARNWKYYYRTNVEALVALSELLVERDWLGRVIQVGSSEVYGGVDAAAAETALANPSSVYAASKLCFDQHLVCIARHWAFPAIVVRPSNCITPGQQVHRVVPKTFILGATGRKLELHGGGAAEKSYMAADDLSAAIALLAERGAVGEIYNAGPEQPISIRHLVALCARCMGRRFEDLVTEVPDRTGQDKRYWLDSSKLRALGWAPRVPIDEAIDAVQRWVAEHLEALAGLPLEYQERS